MSEENKNNNNKKWYKRWLLLIFLFFVFILGTISITIYLIPRVEYLQREFANQIVKLLNNELKGQLELDKIIFHSYNDIELQNARLIVAGDTLANIPKLNLKFKLRNILKKDISVRYLTLHNPTFKLLRLKDSTWNYEHITKIREEVDTSITDVPPISFRKFEINNGKFIMFDSTIINTNSNIFSNIDSTLNSDIILNDKQLNFSNLKFSKINIVANGNILLNDNIHNYAVSKLEMKEDNTNLIINHSFIDEIGLRDKKTFIKGANFNVDESEIKVEFQADNYSVLNSDYSDLEKMNLKIEINGRNVKSDLLNYFTEPILNTNENYELKIFANGNVKNLLINEFNIAGNGVNLKGDINFKNILEPKTLNYNLNLKNSNINVTYYKDKLNFDLQDIPEFGLTYFNEFEVSGGIYDYTTNFNLRSNLGELSGKVFLDINNIPTYEMSVNFKNINLDKIIPGKQISKLNGYIKIKGKEFDPSLMSGNIELKLFESKYIKDKIDTLSFSSAIEKGKLSINEFSLYKGVSKATISGNLDISDIDKIKYDLMLKSNNLDLSKIDESLPDNISGDIKIIGEGIDTENMKLELIASFKDFSIYNKHILKYDFNLVVDNQKNGDKYLKINSEEIDFEVIGNFRLDDLIDLIFYELDYYENNYNITYSSILGQELEDKFKYIRKYPKVDLTFNTTIKNLHKFNEILDLNINTKGNININLITNENNFKFQLNNFDLNNTYLEFEEDPIYSKRIDMNLLYKKSIVENNNEYIEEHIDNLSFNLYTPSLVVAANNIDSLELNLDYYLHHLNLSLLSKINDDILIDTDMILDENKNIFDFRFPKMNIYVDKLFDFKNNDDILLNLDNSNLLFNKFSLLNNNQEELNINGEINFKTEYLDNLNINLNNYDLAKLVDLLEMEEYFSTFEGNLKNMNINLNGYMNEPNVGIDLQGRNIEFNQTSLGNIDFDMKYINHNLIGSFNVNNKVSSLKIDILKLPFNFNLSEMDISMIEDQDLNIILSINQLNAAVIEPFSPGILNITGTLESKVEIAGNQRDGVNYNGNLILNKGSFLVEATNVIYNTEAKVNISNDMFEVVETTIRNRESDLKDGKANIAGFIQMDGFDVSNFEFKIDSKRLKVLRDETRYSMPDFFGDFVVSTGQNPLKFSGNFDKPSISGDVDILNAKLQMPDEMTAQIVESRLHYEFIDDVVKISLKDSLDNTEQEKRTIEKPFLDILNYDLNIRFLGDFGIKLDLDALTQLRINIGTRFKTDVVNYKKNRNEEEGVLLGEIIVKDNSALIFFGKKFETTGIVTFPTGEIDNPQFDILAKYKNFTQAGIPFEVQIIIKGFKDNPNIKFLYDYNGLKATGDQSEIDQNAFSLLTLNMLKEDALGDNSQNSNLQGEMVNYGNSFVSSLASKSLNEALLEYGLVTDINLDLNNPDQSIVKIEGNLFKNIKWSVGGNVSNIENNQISVEVPLGVLFGMMSYIQFTKPNNPFVTQENQLLWEFKLKLGKTW